jgi:hypothetical protein
MHGQTRITVDLAVQILRPTLDQTSAGRVDTVPVRLALRCLWTHCTERWPLVLFWEGAQQDDEIGRSQSVTASFNGIVRQLRSGKLLKTVQPTQKRSGDLLRHSVGYEGGWRGYHSWLRSNWCRHWYFCKKHHQREFKDGVLTSYAKGCGLGDCGSRQSFVWDATRFRPSEQADMSECRAASTTLPSGVPRLSVSCLPLRRGGVGRRRQMGPTVSTTNPEVARHTSLFGRRVFSRFGWGQILIETICRKA